MHFSTSIWLQGIERMKAHAHDWQTAIEIDFSFRRERRNSTRIRQAHRRTVDIRRRQCYNIFTYDRSSVR